jgi:hypothetical protein
MTGWQALGMVSGADEQPARKELVLSSEISRDAAAIATSTSEGDSGTPEGPPLGLSQQPLVRPDGDLSRV